VAACSYSIQKENNKKNWFSKHLKALSNQHWLEHDKVRRGVHGDLHHAKHLAYASACLHVFFASLQIGEEVQYQSTNEPSCVPGWT